LGWEHAFAQYEKEKDATVPLDYFYIKRQKVKSIFSKLHFGLSTGVGFTTFKHSLDGFALYQPSSGNPVVYNVNQNTLGITNWFNRVETSPLAINPANFNVDTDTAAVEFKSKSFNIPMKATVHVEFNRFRIGGGFSYEFVKVGDFKPSRFGGSINPYESEVSSFFLSKYFILVGASVYRYENYLLTIDANIGGYGLGKKFEKSQITKGVFVNLGATVEREMSEYFKLFIRPSYEIKSFSLGIAETDQSIKHKFNAFYINIGASYRIPELRKCYVKTCRAQLNHAHGNKEYRSRAHPIYKKQNPQTGENYPELIKYKGKNKKKLNPY